MFVIGTAGHIDHGKSSIVRRLTGTDPDRLPEEKARGMTIDLGFAFYRTPGGSTVAFVDVPGHERFVKNMIAGAGGIDAVLLVVAADDGWMPQTQEHFQIVRMLGIRHGLIVINKIDLVDPDWLELLENDIRDRATGSFLSEAPMVKVSAQTGAGFEDLIEGIESLGNRVEARQDVNKARLYIDRSFVRPGMGGVVTGTLRGGSLSVGQLVSVWPGGATGKIRNLQSNGQNVTTATPGQRTAVAFTGIDKEHLVRGGVVAGRIDIEFYLRHPVLALKLEMLSEAPVSLSDRRRMLVIIGTTEVEGEARIFDQKEILPGHTGLVFFKPDQPVYSFVGDHFIARLPTPMVTLGGGTVLDFRDRFPRRRELAKLDYLNLRMSDDLDSLVLSELQKGTIVSISKLLEHTELSGDQIGAAVERLKKSGRVGQFKKYLYACDHFDRIAEDFASRATDHMKENPHLAGLSIDQLAHLTKCKPDQSEVIADYLVAKGKMIMRADKYGIAKGGVELKGAVKTAYDEVMSKLKAAPFAPPTLSELAAGGKARREAIGFIIESGIAYKCGSQFLFLTETWDEITRFIRECLNQSQKMAVPELRDKYGFSRKYAIPILEETDRIGLTKREGDVRIKGEKF